MSSLYLSPSRAWWALIKSLVVTHVRGGASWQQCNLLQVLAGYCKPTAGQLGYACFIVSGHVLGLSGLGQSSGGVFTSVSSSLYC